MSNKEVEAKDFEFTNGDPSIRERIILNTDDSVQEDSRNAAVGGVLRDEKGEWIFGYNKYLGKCSIFDAELWGILDGLKISQKREPSKIVIQSNSLEAVQAIQGNNSKTLQTVLIKRIHRILTQESNWTLRYTPERKIKVLTI